MVIILGDILADYAIRVEQLEIQPKDLQRVSYLALGPGGACNVAIMAAHLGLSVAALGEVGRDLFGEIVLEGLAAEGVDVSGVIITPDARTPVANVLVDERGEPAYLGFPGSLTVMSLPGQGRQRGRGHVNAGHFDLAGLLASLKAKAEQMGAKRIVFDSIDVLLSLLNDSLAERRELYRLSDWLVSCGLTGIITLSLIHI